jgi:hypothetical protein
MTETPTPWESGIKCTNKNSTKVSITPAPQMLLLCSLGNQLYPRAGM